MKILNQNVKKNINCIPLKQYIDNYLIENNVGNKDFNLNDVIRLIEYITKFDKNNIFLNLSNIYLNKLETIRFKKLLDRFYLNHEPLQYILKSQSFYNEHYYVNKNVLIPRADSEILVETAIKYIDIYNLKSMIDMCCGSGCLGISISKNSNISKCILVDISAKAVAVMNKNISNNNVSKKCFSIVSNLFTKLFDLDDKYDIIVSNPPYIRTQEIVSLSKYVQNEPTIALDGGQDGIQIYIKILDQAKYFLNYNGYIIFEIGYDQKRDIIELVSKYKEYEYLECIKDLGGNDRVIVLRFNKA